MDDVWEDSDRALCVHPGWTPIVGWQTDPRQLGAYLRQRQPDALQSVRYLNIVVQGNFGYVTCVEGVTSVVQGRASNFSIYATNIFARHRLDGWRMIAHHASPGG